MSTIAPFAFSAMSLTSFDVPSEVLEVHVQEKRQEDITKFGKPFDLLSSTDDLISRFEARLNYLLSLEDNWDGMKAAKIDELILQNTKLFLEKIYNYNLKKLSEDNLFPTPYGTILIELTTNDTDLVVEVSDDEISYFVERQNDDFYSEGVFNVADTDSGNFEKLNEAFKIIS